MNGERRHGGDGAHERGDESGDGRGDERDRAQRAHDGALRDVDADAAEVLARRLDAGLHEVLGGERAPDVLGAVLARAAAGDPGERAPVAFAAGARRPWLALAAVFLLGVLTVVGVALLRRGGAADGEAGRPVDHEPSAPQDAGAIVEITEAAAIAALPKATKGVQLRNLDDAAVEELVHRCAGLETLQIWCSTASRRAGDGAPVSVTDRAFAAIAALPALRRLELYGTTDVTGAALRELERLPLLDTLALESFDVEDEHLAALARLPSLRTLSLAFNHVLGPAGIAAIGQCVGLRRLSLRATPGQPRGSYAPLAALRELEELDLGGINVMTRTFADEATGRRLNWRNGGEPIRGGGVRSDVLQDWPRLTTLSLHSAFELEPGAGKLLKERYPRLRSLDLSGCRRIDDTTIVYAVAMPSLRQLRIDGCPNVGEPSIGLLAANDRLREITFGAAAWPTLEQVEALLRSGKHVVWTPPQDRVAGFAALQAKYAAGLATPRNEIVRTVAELDALPDDVTRIECRDLGDRAAVLLAKRPGLVALELVGDAPDDRLTAAGLAVVSALPKLESLVLMNLRELRGEDLRSLGGLRALRTLRCVSLALDDAALEALAAGAPRLEELSLVACRSFGERGMAAIARCARLRRLELPKCTQLDAEALAQVGSLRLLEQLDLSGNPGLHDRAMMPLQHCTALRRLNVADAPFTSMALQALTNLPALEALDLSGNAELVPSALRHLPVTVTELGLDRCPGLGPDPAVPLRDRLPLLRVLRAADNAWVTDDVLRMLVARSAVERIHVARTALTNASFTTIRGAKQLRFVDCNGTACVTQQQQQQLATERPELEIVRSVW